MSSNLKRSGYNTKPGKIKPPEVVASTDNETPVFCLNLLQEPFTLSRCDKDEKAAFADRLALLSKLKWVEIISSQRHGNGCEKISRKSINPPIPKEITDDSRFLAFRFFGKACFIGYRISRTLRIVWIDNKYEVYNH